MAGRIPHKNALLDDFFTHISGMKGVCTTQKDCVLALPQLEVLATMLGLSLDDTSMYRLAWSWCCETPLCIRKSEFMNGMISICNDTETPSSSPPSSVAVTQPYKREFEPFISALRRHIEALDDVLRGDAIKFRQFYRFIYRWIQSPLTTERNMGEVGMKTEAAVELWRMLFPHYREFQRLDDWITFCTSKELFPRGLVSRDLWEQLLEFTAVTDYQRYDVSDAWPSAVDDFVELWYMATALKDVFHDVDDAVCGSLFQSTDLVEKTWRDATVLSQCDDRTFWTVVANHRNLPAILKHLVDAINTDHSSAFSRKVQFSDEISVVKIFVRLASNTSVAVTSHVSVSSVAKRLAEIITPSLLVSVSVMLLRHSGPIASATITAMILLNPTYLCAISNVVNSWCDATSSLAVRCCDHMSRGRHRRLAGDVILLFEGVYRHTKQLWSLLHCAPFLVDYVSLTRTLSCLRVVVDLISPILQHFVLVCDSLASHRQQLSKANSVIVNAAVNTAFILVLFRTYRIVTGEGRSYCVECLVECTYEAIASHITEKVGGVPALLLTSARCSLTAVLHELFFPKPDDWDLSVGELFGLLTKPAPESKDFVDGFAGSRPRFFAILLLGLVQQQFRIDSLLERGLVTTVEAEEWGASERAIAQAIAGIVEESKGSDVQVDGGHADPVKSLICPVQQAVSDNPLVNMVLGVMPHFNVNGIEAALAYYNNDVEQFIIDASIDNITPHILELLTEPHPSLVSEVLCTNAIGETHDAEVPAVKQHAITPADYDDEFDGVDMNLFIACDLYEVVNGNIEQVSCDDYPEEFRYSTLHTGGGGDHNIDEAFHIDEVLKGKIRELTENMYEDEYDDTPEVLKVCGVRTRPTVDDSGSSTSSSKADDGEGGENTCAATPRPETLIDERQLHANRAKQRDVKVKAAREAGDNAPSYTKKKKTVQRKLRDDGGLARAVRKGKAESWVDCHHGRI